MIFHLSNEDLAAVSLLHIKVSVKRTNLIIMNCVICRTNVLTETAKRNYNITVKLTGSSFIMVFNRYREPRPLTMENCVNEFSLENRSAGNRNTCGHKEAPINMPLWCWKLMTWRSVSSICITAAEFAELGQK